jgi:hypothetical protein
MRRPFLDAVMGLTAAWSGWKRPIAIIPDVFPGSSYSKHYPYSPSFQAFERRRHPANPRNRASFSASGTSENGRHSSAYEKNLGKKGRIHDFYRPNRMTGFQVFDRSSRLNEIV